MIIFMVRVHGMFVQRICIVNILNVHLFSSFKNTLIAKKMRQRPQVNSEMDTATKAHTQISTDNKPEYTHKHTTRTATAVSISTMN